MIDMQLGLYNMCCPVITLEHTPLALLADAGMNHAL